MALPTLPTLEELLHPASQPKAIREKALASTDPLDPVQLFNIGWRDKAGNIPHVVLPEALTGVPAPIVVMSAAHYPTGSHKVGPAYSCLREQIVLKGADTAAHTLVFPSTGNYGIGGAWVGPRLGFRSLVVLPEEMSAERFEKIRGYGADVIATPGCESNVKEIYDKVGELRRDPKHVILNQFADFGNYRFHRYVTGRATVELADELAAKGVGTGRVAAFVSAMGSAGTIAAADHIKSLPGHRDVKTVGLEPVQCPTLYNVGYGGHAIEGIGDKHVTWIHNVRAMDALFCIDDDECLFGLQLLQEGQAVLQAELGVSDEVVSFLTGRVGVSGVCNILGAIKTARYYGFGKNDLVVTVATDSFDRYPSVLKRLDEKHGRQSADVAKRRASIFTGQPPTWALEGTQDVRRRWHNQKYFTWVEQQGHTVEQLNALWDPDFWEAEAARTDDIEKKTLAFRSAA